MKAYIGTHKQYKLGKKHKYKRGNTGTDDGCFHAYKNPFDVLLLHRYSDGSRYFLVEPLGLQTKKRDQVSSYKIKINSEVTFEEMLDAAFEYSYHNDLGHKTTENGSHCQTRGCSSHSQTSGDESHSQTIGIWSHSKTRGYSSHSQTCGVRSHSRTTGNCSHSQTSGPFSYSHTSGDCSHSQTSGDVSRAQTSGEDSIACALGVGARAKARKGWIIIVDWRKSYDNGDYIKNIHHAKVGGQIQNVTIRPDAWYWFENGELHEEIEN